MKIDKNELSLLTDLYEFTMAASYWENMMFVPATFSLFIRKYPPDRGYFISAGLDEVLGFLESFGFDQSGLDYLDSTGLFSHDFLNYLSQLRFNGEVYAIAEGRLFFKDEPILEVTAPIIEAQLVETFIINAINLQVTIATKASRCSHAAQGRDLVDFSLRRTQGTDAGLKVARASYLAGFKASSNVLAGKRYGIPVSGTMAHSYITSFENETDAFRAFFKTFPKNTVLLIDTYDTVEGAKKAVQVAREFAQKGFKLKGVRLDSGDMAKLSKEVRKILNSEGMKDVSIFASGGFDEHKINDVVNRGAKIDAFGVGTKMGVSADGPFTDIAYKMVQYGDKPVLKLSTGKMSLTGQKQIFRRCENGKLKKDIIGLRDEHLEGEKILKKVMKDGKRETIPDSLDMIRDRFYKEFSELADDYKKIKDPAHYPVELGPGLQKLQKEIVQEVKAKELGDNYGLHH